MRRPQPERVLSLAAFGASGAEEEEEEEGEREEEVDVDEVALAVGKTAAALLSRGFLALILLVSLAAAREGAAKTTERRGMRAWAEAAAAARGAGKDMFSLTIGI